MDPFSQAALGAVVGQISGQRQLGYRAAALGALAGALPDVDVLFAVGGDYFDQLVMHRGITHSLFFAPVVGPLLGWMVWRVARRRTSGRSPPADARPPIPALDSPALDSPALDSPALDSPAPWMLVATMALWSHPLLDYLTPYGTQLLLPFSDQRFAVNAMPIIDPLYTALLVLGLGLAIGPLRRYGRAAALATLLVSCGYLAYGGYLNHAAERLAARQLAAAGIDQVRVAAFPTILQIHYRRVVARSAKRDMVGFVSMWQPCPVDWTAAPRSDPEDPAIRAFRLTREGRIFDWFTMGWARYRVTSDAREVAATDLRYGFNDDPDRSIFNASAMLDAAGRLAGPVLAGRDAVDAVGQRLRLLLRDTYTPLCSSQSSSSSAAANALAGMGLPYR